jgi:iron complex outermembrane receptor protein
MTLAIRDVRGSLAGGVVSLSGEIMRSVVFRRAVSAAVGLAVMLAASMVSAQTVSGRLVNSLSGDLIAGAVVEVEGQRRQTTSAADGTFTFDGLPNGTYHLIVRAQGYSSRRTEIKVPGTEPLTVQVDPELHFEEVVSVGPEARSQFDSFQPTSVLSGQELTKQLAASLGATLENQSGVASRGFGPAPSRPVIRGLDGDRVLILQDGQRMGDLSSQSGDHGVTINPASADRIEVVRGPATLLYGANAIGGLVNVITNDIPMKAVRGTSGNMTFDLGSSASEAGAAADVQTGNGTFALTMGGGGRRSGDFSTPEGEVPNSQARSGFGKVGLSWTGTKNYLGASYGYDDTKYGIPVLEDGQVSLTPRRHSFSLRGGGDGLTGVIESFRSTLAIRRYKHEEREGGEVGTAFTNDTAEVELMAAHRAVGRLKGSAGAWFLNRDFDAIGAEALSPAVGQRGAAAFVYEELTWPHATVQFGGRFDRVNYDPAGEPSRSFTTGSGSLGLLLRPSAGNESLTVALSLARAARAPSLEELFYFGLHRGNFAFEVGNPDLRPEHALGFDASLRWRVSRASGEVTYFRNSIRNYVYRQVLTEEEFAARLPEFAARFPDRDIEAPDEEAQGFPIVENVSADSVLQGVEAHADVQIAKYWAVEAGIDYVRGSLADSGDPLPRIPPLRFRGGLRFQRNAFQAGADFNAVAAQERVGTLEPPTSGYDLLKAFAAYSFNTGRVVNTITARLDNATNALYRNHLSLIKELVPEMGRNFRLLYNVRF